MDKSKEGAQLLSIQSERMVSKAVEFYLISSFSGIIIRIIKHQELNDFPTRFRTEVVAASDLTCS